MKSSSCVRAALYAACSTLLVLALCFDSLAFSSASTAGIAAATDPQPSVDEEAAAAAAVAQFFSERTAFSVTDRDEPRETTTSAAPSPTAAAAAAARPVSPFGSFAQHSFAHVIGPATERIVRLTNANNEFAFRLAKALIKSSPRRNIFFSPLTLFRFVQCSVLCSDVEHANNKVHAYTLAL